MKTAILVDGGFYRRRAQSRLGEKTAKERADELKMYCYRHLYHHGAQISDLYRIFYYDCPPMDKKVYHPLLQKQVDFSRSELRTWMLAFIPSPRGYDPQTMPWYSPNRRTTRAGFHAGCKSEGRRYEDWS